MATIQFVRRGSWAVLIASYAILAGMVHAQDRPDMKSMKAAFQEQQKQNETMLRRYSWKARTEVRVGDEVKSTLLELVRFDASGRMEKTTIGGQPPKSKRQAIFPIVRLIDGIKEQKVKDYNNSLKKLIDSYANIPPEKMQGLMATASFQPGSEEMQGTIKVIMPDAVKKGDAISLWIDPKGPERRRLEVCTSLGKDAVQIVTEFDKLTDGTQYTRLSMVEIKAKKMRITTEHFDFDTRAKL
jgi:hypothetical protein